MHLFLFRELRRKAARLYSDPFSAFVRDSVAMSYSQTDVWRTLTRLGLIGERKGPGHNILPTDFADFLLNLPGGEDPRPDFEVILDCIGRDFDPGRFYFSNITTEEVIREVLKFQGYRAIGPDGIHMRQLLVSLEFLHPFWLTFSTLS